MDKLKFTFVLFLMIFASLFGAERLGFAQSQRATETVISWDRLAGMSAALKGESNEAALSAVVPGPREDLIELNHSNGSIQPEALAYLHSAFEHRSEICGGDDLNQLSCAVTLVRSKHKADVAAFRSESNNRCSQETTICFIEQAVVAERWLSQNWGRLSDRDLLSALPNCGSVRSPSSASLECLQAIENARLDELDRFEDTMYRFMEAAIESSVSDAMPDALQYSDEFEYLSYIERVFRDIDPKPLLDKTTKSESPVTSLDSDDSDEPDDSEHYVMSALEQQVLDKLGAFKIKEAKWRAAFSLKLQSVVNRLNQSMLGKLALQELQACEADALTRIARTRRNYENSTDAQKDCLVELPKALGKRLEKSIRDYERGFNDRLAESAFCGNDNRCAETMRNHCAGSKRTSRQTPIELLLLPTRGQPESYLIVDPFAERSDQKVKVQPRHSGEIWAYNLINGACVPTGLSIAENASRELSVETGDPDFLYNAISLPDWVKQVGAGECARQVKDRSGICWNNLSVLTDGTAIDGDSYPNFIDVTGDLHINFKLPLFDASKWFHFDLVVSSGQSESIQTQLNTQLTDYFQQWRNSLSRELRDFGRRRGLNFELVGKNHTYCTLTPFNSDANSAPAFVNVVVDVAIKIPNMKSGLCGTFGLSQTGEPNFTWGKPSPEFQSELIKNLVSDFGLETTSLESDPRISIIAARYPDVFAGDRDLVELDLQIDFPQSDVEQFETCNTLGENANFTLFINTKEGLRLGGLSDSLKRQVEGLVSCLESQLGDEISRQFAAASDDFLNQLKNDGWEISGRDGTYQVCIPIDAPPKDGNNGQYALRKIVMRTDPNQGSPEFDFSGVELIKSRTPRNRCRGRRNDLEQVKQLLKVPIQGDNVELFQTNSASDLSYDARLNVPRLGWITIGRAHIEIDKNFRVGFKFEQTGSLQKEILQRVLSDGVAEQGLKNIANSLGFKSLCSSIPSSQFPKETDDCKIPPGRDGVFMARSMDLPMDLEVSCRMPLISIEESGGDVRVDVLASSANEIHCDTDSLKAALSKKLESFLAGKVDGSDLVQVVCTPSSVDERICPGFSSDDFIALKVNLSALGGGKIPALDDAGVTFSDIVLTPNRILDPGGIKVDLGDAGYVNFGYVALIDTAVTLSFSDLNVIRANGVLTIEGGGPDGTREAAKAIRFDISALLDLARTELHTEGKLIVANSAAFAQTKASLKLREGVFGFSGETIGDLAKVVPAGIRGCLIANGSNVFTGLSANLKVLELSEANANILLIGKTEGKGGDTLGFKTVPGCNSLPAFKHLRRKELILFAEMESDIVDVQDVLVRIEAKRRPSDSSAAARFGFMDVANLGIDLNPQRAKAILEVLGLAISIVTPDVTGLSRDELERIIKSIIQPELPSIEQLQELLKNEPTITVAPLTWESGSENVSFSDSGAREWSKDDIADKTGNTPQKATNTRIVTSPPGGEVLGPRNPLLPPPADEPVPIAEAELSQIYTGGGGPDCQRAASQEVKEDVRAGAARIWSGGECLSIYGVLEDDQYVIKAAMGGESTPFESIPIDWAPPENLNRQFLSNLRSVAPGNAKTVEFFKSCLGTLADANFENRPKLTHKDASLGSTNEFVFDSIVCEKRNGQLIGLIFDGYPDDVGYLSNLTDSIIGIQPSTGNCDAIPLRNLYTAIGPGNHASRDHCLYLVTVRPGRLAIQFETIFDFNASRHLTDPSVQAWAFGDTLNYENLHLGRDFFLHFGADIFPFVDEAERDLILHPCVSRNHVIEESDHCAPILIKTSEWLDLMIAFWKQYDPGFIEKCSENPKTDDCALDALFKPFYIEVGRYEPVRRPDPWRLLQIVRHSNSLN